MKLKRYRSLFYYYGGSDAPFGGAEICNNLNLKMKNSSAVIFENSGHLPWIDKPGIHAAEIREFLNASGSFNEHQEFLSDQKKK